MSDKKIGASKYKNKQRYKNKAKVLPKTQEHDDFTNDDEDKIVIDDDYPFRRRGLESNWHRYEIKDDVEEVIDVAKDFSAIVSAPISHGSYFQFKRDKNIDSFDECQLDSEVFKLDMNLMSLSMATIPFYTRCNIDEKYFSENALNNFNVSAKWAKEQYEKMLSDLDKKKSENESNIKLEEDTNVEEDSAEPVKIECGHQENIGSDHPEKSEKEKLEEWLDDILDD